MRRKRSINSLVDYSKAITIPGAPVSDDPDEWVFRPIETGIATHHILIMSALQRVFEGVTQNLMMLLPPGSAKSTYGSVVFPTWAMGKQAGMQIIMASYGSDLARKQGRRSRQIVRGDQYTSIFDTKLSGQTSAADEWALENGSEYMACGILSGVTGNRADGLIVDDPIKGRDEADSLTIREKTWAAYQDDLLTRLKPGGWQVFINTRWHEDDPCGRILPEGYSGESGIIEGRDGRTWEVLCIPAQAERDDDPLGRQPGEYLWPEWFPENHWQPFRRNPRSWSSLFQQRPAPEEGTYFQRNWFRRYEYGDKPKHLNIYIASDFAVSEGQGDYTEHGVFGTDSEDNLYLLDWWSGQKTADVWIDALCDLFLKWKPHCWFGESGPIRRAIEPFLTKRMLERQAYCRVEWIASTADKPTRARSFQARASMGKVFLPFADWADRLLAQLLVFPAGKHDDAVDVCSLMGMVIDQSHPAVLPPARDTRDSHQKRLDSLLKPQADDPFFEGPREIDPWTEAMKGQHDDSGYFSTVE